MTSKHPAVVACARLWIGTPYVHQASRRGVGADCLGLVRGVWREVCGPEPVQVPPYTSDWSEARGEERLWAAAARHLQECPVAERTDGTVLLFRMRDSSVAKHLGIQASSKAGTTVIHAYSGHGVIESALVQSWERRIVACFSYPQKEV